MIYPPPIQAPFTVDEKGKLSSGVWILWLQSLANNSDLAAMFANTQMFQNTDTSFSTQVLDKSQDADMLCWMSF